MEVLVLVCPIHYYNFIIINNSFVLIEDIDECANVTLSSLCSQRCVNNIGSYECQCDSGYELTGDKSTCNGKYYKYLHYYFPTIHVYFCSFCNQILMNAHNFSTTVNKFV